MRTLIISDLHLGGISRSDLLRRQEIRARLLQELEDVDRLVLLGDVLELRHGPPREALAIARPFFEDLGSALAGRELVLVAGNHDHLMIEPWLARRAEADEHVPLALEQLLTPAEASPMIERFAAWASQARVTAAYPGLWLRPDVYATHGHYLDCHLTVPTLERLSVGAMSRLLRRPTDTFARVDDYEAVTSPMYAWRHAAARDARTGNVLNGIATVNAWRALGGGGARPAGAGSARGTVGAARRNGGAPSWRAAALRRYLMTRALVRGFPLAVAALNRAGLGPLSARVGPGELRRAGLSAMGEVARRLGLGEAYVVFGHTHRAGPMSGDDEREWNRPPSAFGEPGARLVNSGSWTYDGIFLRAAPGESPYWPGTCVLVEDSGPPQLRRLLLDRTHAQLKPPPTRSPA